MPSDPYLPKASTEMRSPAKDEDNDSEDEEEIRYAQDSEEFLDGYGHDNPCDLEGAIAPSDQEQLKFASTKFKPKECQGCKTIGMEDVDWHLLAFLHVQQLLEGDPHCGCHHKVVNHQYGNSAAGMLYTF